MNFPEIGSSITSPAEKLTQALRRSLPYPIPSRVTNHISEILPPLSQVTVSRQSAIELTRGG